MASWELHDEERGWSGLLRFTVPCLPSFVSLGIGVARSTAGLVDFFESWGSGAFAAVSKGELGCRTFAGAFVVAPEVDLDCSILAELAEVEAGILLSFKVSDSVGPLEGIFC